MYYYVNGTVAEIDAGLAVIDCGGVKIGGKEKIAPPFRTFTSDKLALVRQAVTAHIPVRIMSFYP